MVLLETGFDDPGGLAPRLDVAPWRSAWPDEADWHQLSEAASEPNPFFESWLLGPALEAFDPAGRVLLAALRIDGQLAGIVPLRFSSTYYGHPLPHLTVWLHPNAFCGVPLIARGFEAMFWSALLDWVDDHASAAAFLHLPIMPEDSAPDTALTEISRDGARAAGVVARSERALLASPLSPGEYYEEALPNKKRKELRRQARRLGELGTLTVERAETPQAASRFADDFLALEAASWKGRAGSSLADDAACERFFRLGLVGAAERGRFEGLSLTLDTRPIAMLASFLTPPGAFSFKTTFDADYARYSPGVLLQKENLDLLQRDGIAWCDSCAAPDHPMIDHFWRGQRSVVSRNVAIGGRLRRTIGTRLIAHESRKIERTMSA